jgi:hypothetical protein
MTAVVAQVVAPGSGGVRDYLECLRSGWLKLGHQTEVIELSEPLARARSLADRVEDLIAASRGADSAPGTATLLVHFSGYGYHKRGLCQWLVQELLDLKKRREAQARVVTMFHELAAFGPPWKSEFWLAGIQSAIAGRMAQLSDAIWTNSNHHAHWLRQRARPSTPIEVYPVFSTIGEPERVPPFSARARRLVIFGSAGTRSRAIRALAAHAAELRHLGIDEAVEVGSGQAADWALPGLVHRRLGRLPEHRLSELMRESAFALIDYPTVHLGKSTVFAAYAVHGCAVINTCRPGADVDGLVEGRHYVRLGQATGRSVSPVAESLGPALRDWYTAHALDRQVVAYARTLDLPTSSEKLYA